MRKLPFTKDRVTLPEDILALPSKSLSSFWTIMWYWFFGLLFSAVALLGNALIILLIIFKPSLRTSTNCLIVSLAVSDFCGALTYFPVICISNFFHKIDLSHAGIWYKVCFTLYDKPLCAGR